MGVIEHSDVIENAVTLGGGGGTDPDAAHLTVSNTFTQPQNVAIQDTTLDDSTTLLTLSHRLTTGDPVPGFGTGLVFGGQTTGSNTNYLASLVATASAIAGDSFASSLDVYGGNADPGGLNLVLRLIGAGYLFLPNAATVPADTPSGGGYLYVEGGSLKYKGSSGTLTTLAPA